MMSVDGKSPLNARIEHLLAAQADALLQGQEFNLQREAYGLSALEAAEAFDLLQLATRLHQNLEPVAPSEELVRRLQSELLGQPNPQMSLALRWRKLPARYRTAARLGGLTLTAGIALLAIRRGLEILGALQRQQSPDGDKGLSLNTAS